MKKIRIEKHGDYYVPQKEVLVCPECGMTIEDYEKNWDGKWLPLEICYWNEEYLSAECPNCHCEFSQIKKRYIDDVNIKVLCGFALLIAGIVFLVLF